MRKKKIGQFDAARSDGATYTIEVYDIDKVIDSGPNTVRKIEHVKEFRTTTGLAVKRICKGEYEIVGTGIRLLSDSPYAV